MKSLFYHLFGFGKIREPLLSRLKSENLIASDEGVRTTITYRNFRAPGRYSNRKRRWLPGALAVTEKRLVLLQFSTPAVDVLFTDERFGKIKISAEADDCLLFAFDPGLFLENSSGEIEYRFRTGQAKLFAAALHKKME